MSRVQLAINVTDVDEAVAFYSKLFNTEPAKRRPGYANFAIAEPPLKLVLIENAKGAGTLNHLGVEVASTNEVQDAQGRLSGQGLPTVSEAGTCCYAVQEKVWVNDPDGAPWEIYTVLADSDDPDASMQPVDVCGASACEMAEVPAGSAAATVKACC
jgi:catechol 2,3-dioxygenase-like lactoylglutathione lyase family enzyme